MSNNYKNLIALPRNKIVDLLFDYNTRIPTKIESHYYDEVLEALEIFNTMKEKKVIKIVEKISKIELDYSEKLRIYLSADYGGKVVTQIYNLIRDSFLKHNYNVYFDINDEITIMDDFRRAKIIADFRPHITININRIRNQYLNMNMFNFTWFMDPTLILYDDSIIEVRKRDFFFCLSDKLHEALLNKKVQSNKIFKQSFATNEKVFYRDSKIAKENLISFIGNNYFEVISPPLEYKNNKKLRSQISKLFNEGNLTQLKLNELAITYTNNGEIKSKEHLEMFIFPAIVRIEVLKWLVKQKDIKIEIYGEGWDIIEELIPFYKGKLNHQSELREVCNRSKYSLLAHPEYFYQQRLMESSACESIPMVYKGINNNEQFEYYDNVLIFSNEKELKKMLSQRPLLPPVEIAKECSYNKFVDKVVNIIKDYK